MPTINEVNDPTRENVTKQQSLHRKSTILVPSQRRYQPPRVAKNGTVEGQLIGSKRNNVKNAPRKRIQSLINQQKERDRNVALYTNVDVQIENIPNKECSIPVQQTDTYDMTTPENSDQRPIPITQDEIYDVNLDDGIQKQNKKYNTNRIQVQNYNGPACISQTALYFYLGNALIDDAAHFIPSKLMGQPPLIQPVFDIEEVANGVVHTITNRTIKNTTSLSMIPFSARFG